MSRFSHLFSLQATGFPERQRKNGVFSGLVFVFLGAGILFAAWLLVQNTLKNRMIEEFEQAVELGKIHVFVKQTDWQSVRKGMKDDLKRRALHNVSLPQEAVTVDRLVEYYVRPENVPELLRYYNNKVSHIRPRDFIRSIYFTGLTEVTVELAIPPQLDKPWLNHQEPVRAVFRLVGTQWLLKKFDAPDYLVPTQAPVIKTPLMQLPTHAMPVSHNG